MITTEMTKKEMLLEGLSKLSFSNEPSFFVQLREQAKKVLNQLELPTSKTEYWKYTRLGKIINKSYTVNQNNEEIDLTAFLIPHLDANIVVLVNGFYREDLSKLEPQNGVIIQSLSKAKIENSQVLEKHFGKYAVAENEIFKIGRAHV